MLMAAVVALIVLWTQLAWQPRRLDRLEFTGDEPAYLITTRSLVEDHDAEESNNYVGETLQPHPTTTDRPGLYSKHGLGLPLLLVIPYAIGGSTLVVSFMSFLGALAAANVALLAKRYCESFVMAGAIGVAMGLSSPLGTFGLLVFPEMPAALCVVYATRRLLARRNTLWQWRLTGVSLAVLPWLHTRFIVIALALVLVAFIRHRHTMNGRDYLAALSAPVVAGVALLAWWTYLYGKPLPASGDHAGFSGPVGLLKGLAGVMIDQQWGLLIYSPLLVLAVATFVPFAHGQTNDAKAIALIAVPYVLFVADFSEWYGGLSSPGRLITAIVPLAGAPLGWWLGRLSPRIAWPIFGLFALPSMAMMALMLADPHRLNSYPGSKAFLFEAFQNWTGFPFMESLPIFIGESAWSPAMLMLASVIALLIVAVLSACAWWLADTSARRKFATRSETD